MAGHARPRALQAREEFAFDQKVMGYDGRDVTQLAFPKTTVAAVNERSWEVKGQEKGGQSGGHGCHPGERGGAWIMVEVGERERSGRIQDTFESLDARICRRIGCGWCGGSEGTCSWLRSQSARVRSP